MDGKENLFRRKQLKQQKKSTVCTCILRGIICQVEEKADVVHGAIFLKVRLKEASRFHVNLRHQQHHHHHHHEEGFPPAILTISNVHKLHQKHHKLHVGLKI